MLKLATTVSSCGDFHFVPSQTLFVVNSFLRIYVMLRNEELLGNLGTYG